MRKTKRGIEPLIAMIYSPSSSLRSRIGSFELDGAGVVGAVLVAVVVVVVFVFVAFVLVPVVPF